MSDSKLGALNPMYGRTGALNPMYGKSGPLNPMYGKYGITPTNAMTINVYSLDNVLVRSFSSQVACGKWLDVSHTTVQNYIKSGKVFRKQYLIVRSP